MTPVADLWTPLAAARPHSRVVLRLADGREIDVDTVRHYCGLVVITPAEPIMTAPAIDNVDEYAEAIGEYDSLTPGGLRALISSHDDASFEDMAAMLEFLREQKVNDVDQLRARLALLPEPPPAVTLPATLPTCYLCGKPSVPNRWGNICPDCDDIPF